MVSQEYKNTFKDKRVAFCGIGVSNSALFDIYKNYGAHIIACDKKSREAFGEKADQLEKSGIELSLGENYLDNIDADVFFRTPGMNYNLPALIELRNKGVIITSEMEEFFKNCSSEIFAITGSDGKTTTTTIISELLKTEGKKVFLGGNIGTPLLPRVDEITENDVAVAELSSFQLISMTQSPHVAVVTNLSPNHLDIHKDMDEYIEAKKNIFKYQNKNDRLVANNENEITASFIGEQKGELITFGHNKVEGNCVYIDNEYITIVYNGETTRIVNIHDIRVPGDHNVQNYMAAIAAVWNYVSVDTICKVAKNFNGVEHRIEFVREVNGVKWYNDSIATSPTRAIAGMNSFNQKLIIIAGGYDKHIPFEPFAEKVITNCKVLILMGATSEAIEKCVKEQEGYSEDNPIILNVDSMEKAVNIAKNIATPGDIVTLSPACASFDKYINFAARGNHFKSLVNEL